VKLQTSFIAQAQTMTSTNTAVHSKRKAERVSFARGPRPTSTNAAAHELSKYTDALANFMKETPSRKSNLTLFDPLNAELNPICHLLGL
jgi:hypothetical protein